MLVASPAFATGLVDQSQTSQPQNISVGNSFSTALIGGVEQSFTPTSSTIESVTFSLKRFANTFGGTNYLDCGLSRNAANMNHWGLYDANDTTTCILVRVRQGATTSIVKWNAAQANALSSSAFADVNFPLSSPMTVTPGITAYVLIAVANYKNTSSGGDTGVFVGSSSAGGYSGGSLSDCYVGSGSACTSVTDGDDLYFKEYQLPIYLSTTSPICSGKINYTGYILTRGGADPTAPVSNPFIEIYKSGSPQLSTQFTPYSASNTPAVSSGTSTNQTFNSVYDPREGAVSWPASNYTVVLHQQVYGQPEYLYSTTVDTSSCFSGGGLGGGGGTALEGPAAIEFINNQTSSGTSSFDISSCPLDESWLKCSLEGTVGQFVNIAPFSWYSQIRSAYENSTTSSLDVAHFSGGGAGGGGGGSWGTPDTGKLEILNNLDGSGNSGIVIFDSSTNTGVLDQLGGYNMVDAIWYAEFLAWAIFYIFMVAKFVI